MTFSDPTVEEATMSEQSRDPNSPKSETDKKVPETVLLTAEELRAIAGGAQHITPPPPASKVNTAGNPKAPLGG
jgi:hypothetical protein